MKIMVYGENYIGKRPFMMHIDFVTMVNRCWQLSPSLLYRVDILG